MNAHGQECTAGIAGASFIQTTVAASQASLERLGCLACASDYRRQGSNWRHQPHASTRLLTSFLDAANGPQLRTAALVQDLRQTTVNSLWIRRSSNQRGGCKRRPATRTTYLCTTYLWHQVELCHRLHSLTGNLVQLNRAKIAALKLKNSVANSMQTCGLYCLFYFGICRRRKQRILTVVKASMTIMCIENDWHALRAGKFFSVLLKRAFNFLITRIAV